MNYTTHVIEELQDEGYKFVLSIGATAVDAIAGQLIKHVLYNQANSTFSVGFTEVEDSDTINIYDGCFDFTSSKKEAVKALERCYAT